MTFYPISKILQGSAVAKAIKTVKKGVFTDCDLLSHEEYLAGNYKRLEWKKKGEEEDRLAREKKTMTSIAIFYVGQVAC